MVRVTVNRGTSTARVGSSRGKKRRAKPSMRSGRGTISRSSTGSYGKKRSAKPSMRSGRGTVSRGSGTKRKSRATGMRAGRASGRVKRSGRGYITASGKKPKARRAKPSMRSGRGTISRSSAGSYKKAARRKPSTRSGRGNVRR